MVLNTRSPDWESSALTTKNIVKMVNFLINQCSHHMEASQYLEVRREEKPRGVFRTQSNIYDGAFLRKLLTAKRR